MARNTGEDEKDGDSGDSASDDAIPLTQLFEKKKTAEKETSAPADVSKFISKFGAAFDVKLPKEFTHGGETRKELVFSGRFQTRAQAEKVCRTGLKMDHAALKEYVKANAKEFGVDPLTGRPPPETSGNPVLGRQGSLLRGSTGAGEENFWTMHKAQVV